MIRFLTPLLCSLAFLVTHVSAADTLVVAYVPNWINLKTFAEKIDYPALTHINIAFENPTNEGCQPRSMIRGAGITELTGRVSGAFSPCHWLGQCPAR